MRNSSPASESTGAENTSYDVPSELGASEGSEGGKEEEGWGRGGVLIADTRMQEVEGPPLTEGGWWKGGEGVLGQAGVGGEESGYTMAEVKKSRRRDDHESSSSQVILKSQRVTICSICNIAECCSVLQCVAVRCSALQCVERQRITKYTLCDC